MGRVRPGGAHGRGRWDRDGPVDSWRAIRDEIHAEVCARLRRELGAFVQSYGSKRLDASVLLIPLVGFLPPDDPRVVGTVEAIGATLTGTAGRALPADEENVEGRRPPAGRGRLPALLVLVATTSR